MDKVQTIDYQYPTSCFPCPPSELTWCGQSSGYQVHRWKTNVAKGQTHIIKYYLQQYLNSRRRETKDVAPVYIGSKYSLLNYAGPFHNTSSLISYSYFTRSHFVPTRSRALLNVTKNVGNLVKYERIVYIYSSNKWKLWWLSERIDGERKLRYRNWSRPTMLLWPPRGASSCQYTGFSTLVVNLSRDRGPN